MEKTLASVILTELSDIVYSSVVQLRAAAVRLKKVCKLVGSLLFSLDWCERPGAGHRQANWAVFAQKINGPKLMP